MKIGLNVQDIIMIQRAYRFALKKQITEPFNYGNENMLIVATGPSSRKFWENEKCRSEWGGVYDICLINDAFFKYKDIVFQVKPRFYCIMDSYYFDRIGATPDQIERIAYAKKNRETLNEVNWDLTLIVPCGVSISWITNPRIKIVRINSLTDNRSDFRHRFYFYKKNWMTPGWNNVVQAALYFAITFGYKRIAMLGAEFNFWKNVYINEVGHVIQEVEHCYEAYKVESTFDMEEDYGGYREGTMAMYLSRLSETFSIYSFIKEYADVMGVHIVNYSEGTMIDAFEIAKDM